MARIPKKTADRFIKMVPKYQKILKIAKNHDVNESDTVSILNDIFGEVFGYDKILEVTSEFAIHGTYCDLAIKIDNEVKFLIEAKAIGIDLKDNHIKQAVNYGANHGNEWVILSNGIEWRIYRIRFEKPINYDLVCTFDFMSINPRKEKDQNCLFLIAKEGIEKDSRKEFYEKAKSVNRYVIGSMILSKPILNVIRRELKKLAEGVKIEIDEIENIIKTEVLKREVLEGKLAEEAEGRVKKFYHQKVKKKANPKQRKNRNNSLSTASKESVTQQISQEKGTNEVTKENLGNNFTNKVLKDNGTPGLSLQDNQSPLA